VQPSCLLELSAAYFQSTNIIFLSQQISQQYFQPLIFNPSEQTGHKGSDFKAEVTKEAYMEEHETSNCGKAA
jgi:hypothetical protein